MYCQNCGRQNNDGDAFCASCGAPLGRPGAMAGGRMATGEGSVGAAWRDITSTPGWFGRVLVLCLVGCVPILNFAVEGYGLRWARELSYGRRGGLPEGVFRKGELSTGFFASVVRTALYAALFMAVFFANAVVSGLLGLISPVASTVVSSIVLLVTLIFAIFFFGPAVDACVMRMAVIGHIEAGLNFGEVWRSAGKARGGLIAAALLPRIIVGIVQVLVGILVGMLAGLIVGGGIISMLSSSSNVYGLLGNLVDSYSYGYGYGGYGANPLDIISAFLSIISGIISYVALVSIPASLLNVFSTLFVARAIGHWTARNAPQWASGGVDDSLFIPAGGGGASVGQQPTPTATIPVASPARTAQYAPVSNPDAGTTQLQSGPTRLSLVRKSNGRTYDITSFPATVGKGSAANVRIDGNDSISRVHVRISHAGSSFVVEELGATNRTYLNGYFLSEGESVTLNDGDELKLAEEAFTVRIS